MFSLPCTIPRCGRSTQFTHSPFNKKPHLLQFLALNDQASASVLIQTFAKAHVCNSPGKMLSGGNNPSLGGLI